MPEIGMSGFGIKPGTVRFDDGTRDGTTAKGYLLEWFADVFGRFYTPSSPQNQNSSVTSVTSLISHDNHPSHHPSQAPACDGRNPCNNNDVTDISGKNGSGAEKGYIGLSSATRKQLADYARAHANKLRQGGGTEVDLEAVESFIRNRVEAAVGDPEQVEPEVVTIMEMLFQ
jgi:hypothetical protein